MIRRIFFAVACSLLFSIAQAQEQSYDKTRFTNGLEQIANSNRNYFKNAGWIENNWFLLSNWYPEVLLIKNEDKAQLAKIINSQETVRRFQALNAKKIYGIPLSFQEIEEFNIYLWNELDNQVKNMYGY